MRYFSIGKIVLKECICLVNKRHFESSPQEAAEILRSNYRKGYGLIYTHNWQISEVLKINNLDTASYSLILHDELFHNQNWLR